MDTCQEFYLANLSHLLFKKSIIFNKTRVNG